MYVKNAMKKSGLEGRQIMNFNTGEVIGIKRKLDTLGRVVIPAEYREAFKLEEKAEVEIFMVKNGVFIKVRED